MRKEIRMVGFGGQGIVLAGVILGEAAVKEGLNAVQTQSYGPESRGGAARSEVVISDGMIDYPKVVAPDFLLVFSQPGFDKYGQDVKRSTRIIIDRDLVKTNRKNVIKVPFLKAAEKIGRKMVANTVMVGYLASAFRLASEKSMKEAILEHVPKGTEDLNLKAFRKGWDMGKKIE
ncbi:MAG: 2-oxoacid:acceptor oxidoreductase family protein [Candidatus Aminicenantes bacterium]